MTFSLLEPRFIGALILALTAAAILAVPAFMLEVALTIAFSAILAPGVSWLRRKLHLSLGLTVALIAFVIVGALGVGGYYGIPLFIRGITETLAQLPDNIRKVIPFVQEWLEQARARLEDIFPGDGSIDEFLKKQLPELAGGSSGSAVKFALAMVLGSVVTLGHFLLFLVLTAILSGEWEKNTERARYLIELFAPRQQKALMSFGAKFQSYGVELFLGIGTVMVIFMPIFVALLYFYGGLSIGKSLLFGVILGATSAIPTIGGIITYLILVVVGILNFGLEYEGLKTTFVMYIVAFVIHFAETKFVTPRVLGHRISFTSFAVITVLVGSVLALGIGRGILAGLFMLVVLKSLVEIADEDRSSSAASPDAGVVPASATTPPPLAVVTDVTTSASPAPAKPQRLSMGGKRGRGRR